VGVSTYGESPVAGWFVRENPNQKETMDDLGVPPFMEPPM